MEKNKFQKMSAQRKPRRPREGSQAPPSQALIIVLEITNIENPYDKKATLCQYCELATGPVWKRENRGYSGATIRSAPPAPAAHAADRCRRYRCCVPDRAGAVPRPGSRPRWAVAPDRPLHSGGIRSHAPTSGARLQNARGVDITHRN